MDNKELVLNVLKGMNTNTQTSQFKAYFDSIYNYYITHKKTSFKNLTDMNKAIIDECYNWLNNNTQVNNKPTIKKKVKLETVDLDNLRHKKDGQFEMKLKRREEQFSSLINKPTPKEKENCEVFLNKEFEMLKNIKVILGLGKIGFDSYLKYVRKKYPFVKNVVTIPQFGPYLLLAQNCSDN